MIQRHLAPKARQKGASLSCQANLEMIQSVQLSAWAMGVGLMAATLDPKNTSPLYTLSRVVTQTLKAAWSEFSLFG